MLAAVFPVAFSPYSALLASTLASSHDKTARLWRLR